MFAITKIVDKYTYYGENVVVVNAMNTSYTCEQVVNGACRTLDDRTRTGASDGKFLRRTKKRVPSLVKQSIVETIRDRTSGLFSLRNHLD